MSHLTNWDNMCVCQIRTLCKLLHIDYGTDSLTGDILYTLIKFFLERLINDMYHPDIDRVLESLGLPYDYSLNYRDNYNTLCRWLLKLESTDRDLLEDLKSTQCVQLSCQEFNLPMQAINDPMEATDFYVEQKIKQTDLYQEDNLYNTTIDQKMEEEKKKESQPIDLIYSHF